LGVDSISDFDGLHSRQHNEAVQFYAFDLLVNEWRGYPGAAAAPAEEQSRPHAGTSR
jgi:hypothetical protein